MAAYEWTVSFAAETDEQAKLLAMDMARLLPEGAHYVLERDGYSVASGARGLTAPGLTLTADEPDV